MKRYIPILLVVSCVGVSGLVGAHARADPAAVAVRPVSMNLPDAPNARDIGGYVAQGGKVRTGTVFRSEALNRLTAAEGATLQQDGITQVYDFRTAAEISQAPDVLPASIEHTVVSIDNAALTAQIGKALAGGTATMQQYLGDGKADAAMIAWYRTFVSDPASRGQFTTVLKAIADGNRPVLYHCTGGKDRTGIMTVILLTLLGVNPAQVAGDYLASNDFNKAGNEAAIQQLSQKVSNADLLWPILLVKPEYLAATLDQAVQSFGSLENFMTKGLGVDAATVAKLRQRLIA